MLMPMERLKESTILLMLWDSEFLQLIFQSMMFPKMLQ